MQISFTTLIFQGIPETIAATTLAFVIANVELEWKKIIGLGCLFGLVTYFVRKLPITFGLHTIVLMVLFIITLSWLGRKSLVESIISTILTFLALVLVETVSTQVFFSLFNLSPNTVSKSSFLMIVSGLPAVIILFLLSIVITKIRKRKAK